MAEYVCTLDAKTEEKARRELNEDPENRLTAVQSLRTWLHEQPHITFCTDTVRLLSVLRTVKFDQLKARQMIEEFATAMTQWPQWFRDIDTTDPELVKVLDIGQSVIFPKKDKNGSQIIYYQLGNTDTSKLATIEQFIRGILVTDLYSARDENVQVNGYVFIFDFTGFSMTRAAPWSMDEVKKWNQIWQNSMPGRFKAFHYYNAGSVFEAFMALYRPFLAKKLQERSFQHETLESLYQHIDMECLPAEYLPDEYTGPNIGTMAEVIANYKREIAEPAFRDYVLEMTSEKYGVDESKRPANKTDQ